MLRKDYYSKVSVENKIAGRESRGACRQDELFGGKPPVTDFSECAKALHDVEYSCNKHEVPTAG
jgi:hypothetical protein